jgi:hypothetical protein
MSSPARHKRSAWIALCAVLFLSLSSTFAVLQFHDRADILGEICSATGIKTVAAPDQTPARQDKDGHNIYCALCLNGASLQAALAPVVTQLFAQLAGTQAMPAVATAALSTDSLQLPPSRGPPPARD